MQSCFTLQVGLVIDLFCFVLVRWNVGVLLCFPTEGEESSGNEPGSVVKIGLPTSITRKFFLLRQYDLAARHLLTCSCKTAEKLHKAQEKHFTSCLEGPS